jgi:GNAT superfamily N-acetyltransferase
MNTPTETTHISIAATDHRDVVLLCNLADSDQQRRGVVAYRWIVSCLKQLGESSVVLGLVENQAAGICWVTTTNGASVVHTLYVAERYRGQRLASKMLEMAKLHAGDVPLRALALPGDRNTKNLFERAGMPAQLIVM